MAAAREGAVHATPQLLVGVKADLARVQLTCSRAKCGDSGFSFRAITLHFKPTLCQSCSKASKPISLASSSPAPLEPRVRIRFQGPYFKP